MVKLKYWNNRESSLRDGEQTYFGRVTRLPENGSQRYYFQTNNGKNIPVGGRNRRLIKINEGLVLKIR